jgi:hypothetical protein
LWWTARPTSRWSPTNCRHSNVMMDCARDEQRDCARDDRVGCAASARRRALARSMGGVMRRGDDEGDTETIAGTRKDKQHHVAVDCAPDELRESTKPYALAQRASMRGRVQS